MMSVAEVIEAKKTKAEQGNWVAASGGAEVPFVSRSGRRLLYCYQPTTGRHAYLNCDTDLILSDADAEQCLQLW